VRITEYFHSAQGRFVVQWHITERCNWSCKHCYRDYNRIKDLPLNSLKNILSQCIELFQILHINTPHINIGGGEPFMRKDLFKFFELLDKYQNLRVGVMTNGSFITKEIAHRLSKIKVIKGIQVSLEGMEDVNDAIRGKGAFKTTVKAIELLRKYNIFTRVSMTVMKLNVKDVEPLAVFLKKIGINAFGARRYVPLGKGKQLGKFMLSPQETKDFYLKREGLANKLDKKGEFYITYGCEDGILIQEKDKISKKRFPYLLNAVCAVTTGRTFTIFTNGDILACRRFPVKIGNVLKQNLSEIYLFSSKLQKIRSSDNVHPLCKDCSFFDNCLGGAKCISYAYFKNFSAPDPQCWKLFKNLPEYGII